MQSSALFCAILAFSVFAYGAVRAFCSTSKRKRTNCSSLQGVYTVLDPPLPLRQQLRARALANARLKNAFQINSTFVNDDIAVHTAFSKAVLDLISNHRLPWTRFIDVSADAVNCYLPLSGNLAFDVFVQRVTMHVVIVAILHADLDALTINVHDLDFVSCGINTLWKLSKTVSTPLPGLLPEINLRLNCWLPQYDNPIEYIIPVYETMWRLVAVTVALIHGDQDARSAFGAFLAQPDASQFRQFHNSFPSVEAIIQEALRLHPPTRRISRTVAKTPFPFIPTALTRFLQREVTVAADIELVQRDDIWGHASHTFDAMRHHPERLTQAQRSTLLAFGTGRTACVAKNWAPQAAALLVASILDRIGDGKGLELGVGESMGGREGWEGWTVKSRI